MIYTIGHSNHSIEKFIELLKEFRIETIIEVRTVPKSSYSPHFNKPNLIFVLSQNKIKYIDMGRTLGGRPEDKSVLNIRDRIEEELIETKSWYMDAIDRVIDISHNSKIAIMCSEENPEHCHRGYIISHTLLKKGEEVVHIRGNKKIEKARFFERQGELF